MTTRDFTANVISASKVVPDGNFKDSKASGVWDINEALDLIKGGNWPNAANVNPAAFVDNLFQTHLYNGTGSSQTITNNIDLTKGGLVWLKARSSSSFSGSDHWLIDTVSGGTKYLNSNDNGAQTGNQNYISAFNNNGFTLGTSDAEINFGSGSSRYVSWTFRKQPKFFDIVTYEGTGSARTVAHSLNTTVGMILIKNLDQGDNWAVYHRANTAAPQTDYLILNTTAATADSANWWNDTAPTTSVFTVGTDHSVNASGENYVAYLFAHNNNDGGFGEPEDQDIIKCGSFTDSSSGWSVDLGFEPQFLLSKRVDSSGNWEIVDTMRGFTVDRSYTRLYPNLTNAEQTVTKVGVNSTGFFSTTAMEADGATIIYMAIRRGGMQTPTAASSVFAISTNGEAGDSKAPAYRSTFPVDMYFEKSTGGSPGYISSRLTGSKYMQTNATNAEASDSNLTYDFMNGVYNSTGSNTAYYGWMWKKARGYFDVATWTGTGSSLNVSHNLGVTPEMMLVKSRSASAYWRWYFSPLGATKNFYMPNDEASVTQTAVWNDTEPTSSVFTVGNSTDTNFNNREYIAYLFATVAGVSKVGSFTQSGATNVACGFSGDTPSLIILKRSDDTGDWLVFDSKRGIVAGNDKSLDLNNTDAQVTNADIVDPYSGGFATTSSLTDGDYVFYAIAAIS